MAVKVFPVRVLYIWVYALVSIFFMTFVWFIFYQMIYAVIEVTRQNIPDNPMAQGVVTLVENVWNWWLVIFIFGVLLMCFVYTQRKEGISHTYG